MKQQHPANDPSPGPKRRRGRPAQISRDAVLDAAEKHLDADWTLATIANDLGVSVAAIYHYFPNKDALLVELGRRLMAATALPPLEGDWRIWLRELARHHYHVAVRHPFMADVEGFFRAFVGTGAEELERPLAALEAAGLKAEHCVTAYWLVGTAAMEHARATLQWQLHRPELEAHVQMLNQRSTWMSGKIRLAPDTAEGEIEAMLERALDVVIAGIEHTCLRED